MLLVTLRFRSPKEALIFAGVITVGGILAIAIPRWQQSSRHEDFMKQEQKHKLVAELADRAVHAGDDKRKDCFAAINKVLSRAPKVMSARALDPSDTAPLRDAPVVVVKHAVSVTMPLPASPLLGDSACDYAASKRLHDAAGRFTAQWREDEYDAAAAEANALIDQLRGAKMPPVIAVADHDCTREHGCVGVIAWIATATAQPLAVARVSHAMEHLGWDEDGKSLGAMFAPAIARWRN